MKCRFPSRDVIKLVAVAHILYFDCYIQAVDNNLAASYENDDGLDNLELRDNSHDYNDLHRLLVVAGNFD